MSDPVFTILMPVVRTPEMMSFAIRSVLGQTREDFELFIVCDGAPGETVAAANLAVERDRRIRVFDFLKGERHGEAHRHTALEQARGQFICQIADDDLWMPDHLREVATLLNEFEFGNLLHINITGDGVPFLAPFDLSDATVRKKMASEVFNFFAPTNAAYRVDTYRRMPAGWSPAPDDLPTDLAMWRKFLALPEISAGTRFVISALHFPADQRREWTIERRRDEIARYAALIGAPEGCDQLRQEAFRGLAREHSGRHDYLLQTRDALRRQREESAAELETMRQSWSWRLTAFLRSRS